ncbi:MAG: type II toxin-antitoxin system RelE/ParE family toxin [Holophaga sp.]|jgi:plasmid stabilization system protein ParE
MVVKLEWTQAALAQLEQALDFIAQDDPRAADKLWRKVEAATKTLLRFPRKGRMVSEYQDPDVLELIVGPFRILYFTYDPEVIQINVVFRGGQSFPG